MTHWVGYADFAFVDSAHLAFARAGELAETDAHNEHPEAWVIEDRRISFSLDAETSRHVLSGMKRMLDLLALQAVSGDALVEVEYPHERWVRRAAIPSVWRELARLDALEGVGGPNSETIRSSAS